MRVVLISTYELGHQPFGLASPARWLRDSGHEVTAVDVAVSPFPSRAVREADWVCFYLPMHTATRMAAPLVERTRTLNPDARLAAYGLYAPLNAEYLRTLGIEATIGGEFEAALLRVIEGGDSASVSLDRLRFRAPDRSQLPALRRYASAVIDGERRVAGYTEASRGCKHLCRHCPIVPVYQGAFRVVQPEIVLEDIRAQVAAGAQHITFGDPDFFNGLAHALRIVEALHAEFPSLTYDVTIKIEHLLRHRDLLRSLAATGCAWITSAVESTQDEILAKLEKGHTRADFLQALRLCREAGLHLAPTFVPFTPWTTLAGYRDLLRVILAEDLVDAVAPVQLALRLLIPRGSRILELPDAPEWLRGFDSQGLLHRWSHPDPSMDALAAQVFDIAARKAPRRVAFQRIWEAAHGEPPPDYSLVARCTIPYLDEPWYC